MGIATILFTLMSFGYKYVGEDSKKDCINKNKSPSATGKPHNSSSYNHDKENKEANEANKATSE